MELAGQGLCKTGSAKPLLSVPDPWWFCVYPRLALLAQADVLGSAGFGWTEACHGDYLSHFCQDHRETWCMPLAGTRERPHKGSNDNPRQCQMPAWLSRDKPVNGSPGFHCSLPSGRVCKEQASVGQRSQGMLKGSLSPWL